MVMPPHGPGPYNPASYAPAPEQIPVPCARCGAPMQESAPAALHGPVQLACPYCRAVETLPADPAQRVMALRTRLAQIRWAQEAADGPALAASRIMESRTWLPGLLIAVVVLGSTAYNAVGSIQAAAASNAPPDVRAEVLGTVVLWPAISLGVVAGALLGWFVALRRYRESVRPELMARPPAQAGQPARCRRCGGTLPAVSTAFVTCAYCAAQNLVTPEIARDRLALLEREARTYQERAAGVTARAVAASQNFQRFYYIGGGIGLAVAIVLAVAARFALVAILS
jgi:hypothetical protein